MVGKEVGNAGQKTAGCTTGEARFYDKETVGKQGNGESMGLGMRAARTLGKRQESCAMGTSRHERKVRREQEEEGSTVAWASIQANTAKGVKKPRSRKNMVKGENSTWAI